VEEAVERNSNLEVTNMRSGEVALWKGAKIEFRGGYGNGAEPTSSIPRTAEPPPTSLVTNVERESGTRSNPLAMQRRTSLVAFGVSLNASAAEMRADNVDGRVIRSDPTGMRQSILRASVAWATSVGWVRCEGAI
jgi:hypothetical protein